MKNKKNFIYFYGGAVGGFLLTLFLLENIRGNFVNKKYRYIVVVPSKKSLYEELTVKYPNIEIIEFGKNSFLKPSFEFVKILLQENYIFSAPSFSSEPLYKKITSFLLKIFNKKSIYIGFENRNSLDILFYNKLFKKEDVEKSVFDQMKDILEYLNLKVIKDIPDFDFEEKKYLLDKNNLNKGKYIVVHPFAANRLRSFPNDRWVNIISKIAKQNQDKKIVITGAKNDNLDAEEMFKKLSEKNIVNFSGKFDLQELMNILNGCWFFVGVDTGVTHMAGMIQKPSLIFGNYSNPCWLPYYNKNAKILMNRRNCTCKGNKQGECSTLYRREKYYKCLFDITDKQIEEGLDFFYRQ